MKIQSPVLVAALAVLVFSCAPHAKYQHSWPNVQVSHSPEGTLKQLAIVEFDEQGDFWDTDQLKQSLAMIRATPKPLLVTYVHGWRHDARQDDADLIQFKKFIDEINRVKPGGYTACGLYIGWRGGSVEERLAPISTIPALLSFWDRKGATDRMADVGLSRTLTQTSAAAWNKGGRTVAMGHSFGGRILERTAGMSVVSQSGSIQSIKPLADLIILINPASESLTARKLKLALQEWNKSYPLIVAIGATDDGANGTAWKYGYKLSPQPRTRRYEKIGGEEDRQNRYLSTTVTNDERQFTHDLGKSETTMVPRSEVSASATNLGGLQAPINKPIWIDVDGNGSRTAYYLNERDPRKVEGVPFVLDSDAYWTFNVPTEILSGHSGDRKNGNGIFSVPMTDLMKGIFAKAELAQRENGGPKVKPTTSEIQTTPSNQ